MQCIFSVFGQNNAFLEKFSRTFTSVVGTFTSVVKITLFGSHFGRKIEKNGEFSIEIMHFSKILKQCMQNACLKSETMHFAF